MDKSKLSQNPSSKSVPPKAPAKPEKQIEIPKGVSHKDLVGKTVTIHLKDRAETSFVGHLSALTEMGAVTTGVLRGRKPYIDMIPMQNISYISATLDGDAGE